MPVFEAGWLKNPGLNPPCEPQPLKISVASLQFFLTRHTSATVQGQARAPSRVFSTPTTLSPTKAGSPKASREGSLMGSTASPTEHFFRVGLLTSSS